MSFGCTWFNFLLSSPFLTPLSSSSPTSSPAIHRTLGDYESLGVSALLHITACGQTNPIPLSRSSISNMSRKQIDHLKTPFYALC